MSYGPAGHGGVAVAAGVVADDPEVLGQRVGLGVPHRVRGAEGVGQHDDRSVLGAGDDVVDGDGAHDVTRSKIAARPWPPPMHMVSSP